MNLATLVWGPTVVASLVSFGSVAVACQLAGQEVRVNVLLSSESSLGKGVSANISALVHYVLEIFAEVSSPQKEEWRFSAFENRHAELQKYYAERLPGSDRNNAAAAQAAYDRIDAGGKVYRARNYCQTACLRDRAFVSNRDPPFGAESAKEWAVVSGRSRVFIQVTARDVFGIDRASAVMPMRMRDSVRQSSTQDSNNKNCCKNIVCFKADSLASKLFPDLENDNRKIVIAAYCHWQFCFH